MNKKAQQSLPSMEDNPSKIFVNLVLRASYLRHFDNVSVCVEFRATKSIFPWPGMGGGDQYGAQVG